jgi:hypothetical protein
MAETSNVQKCSKPYCEVGSSGLCSDGHNPLQACPAYGKLSALTTSPAPVPTKAPIRIAHRVRLKTTLVSNENAISAINLLSGEALETQHVDKMLLAHPIKLVSIIGDRGSGKSTLIGTLYDKFREGPFGKYAFAGSRTLVGFDRLSFYSRVEGGESEPDTIRTSRNDGLKYFHLELSEVNNYEKKNHLLISDRAGEVYKEARANIEQFKGFLEIGRCLTLVILLDGQKIINLSQKNNAFTAVRQTLRGLVESGVVNSSTHIQIVTSKYDLVLNNVDADNLIAEIHAFNEKLATEYANKFAELTFWNIAARDPSLKVVFGHGLAELLEDWINKKRTQMKQLLSIPAAEGSEFDMLLNRIK